MQSMPFFFFFFLMRHKLIFFDKCIDVKLSDTDLSSVIFRGLFTIQSFTGHLVPIF